MAKKLIPHRVTNIGVHKNVMNNRSGSPEFTRSNCITNMDVLAHVLDMKNKIIVKSFLLYDDLKEGGIYDLRISQDMEDHTTREYEVQKRERLNMKLSKIEIPSNDGELNDVTYVFEKDDYVQGNWNDKVKHNVDIDIIVEKTINNLIKHISDKKHRNI